jgi:hypothetical protein
MQVDLSNVKSVKSVEKMIIFIPVKSLPLLLLLFSLAVTRVHCKEEAQKRALKERCLLVQGFEFGTDDPGEERNLMKRKKRTKGIEPLAVRIQNSLMCSRSYTAEKKFRKDRDPSFSFSIFSRTLRGPPVV